MNEMVYVFGIMQISIYIPSCIGLVFCSPHTEIKSSVNFHLV